MLSNVAFERTFGAAVPPNPRTRRIFECRARARSTARVNCSASCVTSGNGWSRASIRVAAHSYLTDPGPANPTSSESTLEQSLNSRRLGYSFGLTRGYHSGALELMGGACAFGATLTAADGSVDKRPTCTWGADLGRVRGDVGEAFGAGARSDVTGRAARQLQCGAQTQEPSLDPVPTVHALIARRATCFVRLR